MDNPDIEILRYFVLVMLQTIKNKTKLILPLRMLAGYILKITVVITYNQALYSSLLTQKTKT
jgi:hypothetical protein